MNVHRTYIHGEGFQESHVIWLLHCNVIGLLLGCWSTDNVTTTMVFCCDSSWRTVHYLFNVRTWAIFFLRHLANMSSMVPLRGSTDSGFVPNLGPRIRSHAVRRRLFIVLMIAAHISPNVFPSETSSATYMYYFYHTFTVIHTNYTSHSNNIYILLLLGNHSVTSSIPPGRPTALGLLCQIQYILSYINYFFGFGSLAPHVSTPVPENNFS